MSVRLLVAEVDPSTINVTRFCRVHGISTWFFWDLRRRIREEGDSAIMPKSRAPHVVWNKTPVEIEDEIVRWRKQLVEAGLDAGPASIRVYLAADLAADQVPSEATIWRKLTERGFIVPDPSKAPKGTGRRFCAERANDWWGLDDTTWHLADGSEVKILNVIDDHSRLLVASTAMRSCTAKAVLTVLMAAATVLGLPAAFLSDNAAAFRYPLADALATMGIGAKHSRPYHPQTNGKVERFHKTLKQWLAKQPPAATLAELQAQLDLFRYIYNHRRPHRGINRRYPADVWNQAPKTGPSTHALGTPTRTSQNTVRGSRIEIGRQYRITLGAAYNGRTAFTIITGTACHIFIDGRLIRDLTLDPTHHDYPLNTNRLP
jgi:transposase InsO family protein